MSFKRAFITTMALMLVLPGLALAQGGDVTARFLVTKAWTDGSGGADTQATAVDVNITCTTGLPLSQDATITTGEPTEFVLGDLLSLDDVDCTITESVPAGYIGSYSANAGGASALNCTFAGGATGNVVDEFNTCAITNTPAPVSVSVYTDWEVLNEGGDAVDQSSEITIDCNAPIVGVIGIGGTWSYTEDTYGDDVVSVDVIPDPSGSSCSASDDVTSSAVEKWDNCGSMSIGPGVGDSCGFHYTVFFEGIPTLSQYGLAIMALLMLGMGFVGFRRFV